MWSDMIMKTNPAAQTTNYYFYKGRVALYAILKAMGVGPGDEIIVPGYTCVVVPNAIIYLGARPVYADINSRTFNLDPGKVKEKITEKTKAIVAQHTFGIPAEMDSITEIADTYNLYIIEDSCHTMGSKYKGRETGSFGDAAFFSSQWSKPVTTGLGGWARINNPRLRGRLENMYPGFVTPSGKDDLALRLQYYVHSKLLTPSLFWFAQTTYRTLSKYGLAVGSSTCEELECKMPGDYKRRMTKWQRKIIEKKLAGISAVIDHRRAVVVQYEKLLPQAGIVPLGWPGDFEIVFLRYPVLVKDKSKVLAMAKKNRIEVGDWFLSPVHPNLSGWEKASYEKGMCPNAEWACDHVINLPTHQGIKNREIEKTVDFISRYRGLL
jgi:dTDP-4-amino-4,6-dideoxygalactose transaminase